MTSGAPCEIDGDCDWDAICAERACTPGERPCESHADCHAGDFCEAWLATCRRSGTSAPETECGGRGLCGGYPPICLSTERFVCDERDTCVPRACESPDDCDPGDRCAEGTCRG